MKTKEQLQNELDAFKGDKRTKEYKLLKEELSKLEPLDLTKGDDCDDCKKHKESDPHKKYVSKEEYDFIQGLSSPIEWDDVKRVFKINNRLYNKKHKPCRCTNRIRNMIKNLKKNTLWIKE